MIGHAPYAMQNLKRIERESEIETETVEKLTQKAFTKSIRKYLAWLHLQEVRHGGTVQVLYVTRSAKQPARSRLLRHAFSQRIRTVV